MNVLKKKACGTLVVSQHPSTATSAERLYRDIGRVQFIFDAQGATLLELAEIENASKGISDGQEQADALDLEKSRAQTVRKLKDIWQR